MKTKDVFRMNRGRLGLVLVLMGLIVIGAWPRMAAAATGAEADTAAILQQKMDRIQHLQARLKDKVAAAVDLVEQLDAKAKVYDSEIRQDMSLARGSSPAQIIAVPRIHYNLELIARIAAYRNAVQARIDYFRLGHERLTFLLRQASDDLNLAKTFTRVNADKLAKHIDAVLAEYRTAVAGPLFDASHLSFPTVKSEWAQLNKAR